MNPRDIRMCDVDPVFYRVRTPVQRPYYSQTARRAAAPRPENGCGEPVPLYLARRTCKYCSGHGWRGSARDIAICWCVWRRVSRHVLGHLHYLSALPAHRNYRVFSTRAEYAADVDLLARRVLQPVELAVFRLFLVERLEWRLASRRVKLDRGRFFHMVYRVEEAFGFAAASTPLFPMRRYFAGFYNGPLNLLYRRPRRLPFLAWDELWMK